MTSRERVFALLDGKKPDRTPNFNILMAFSARQNGHTYREYASDYRVLCECDLKCCETFSIDLLSQTFDIFRQIGEKTGIDSSLIKLMVKVIAIGYLVEFAAGVVEDFGAKSVADKLIFAGKVIIFSVSLPVLQTLLSLIGSFLELV